MSDTLAPEDFYLLPEWIRREAPIFTQLVAETGADPLAQRDAKHAARIRDVQRMALDLRMSIAQAYDVPAYLVVPAPF